jgi:hypothetical protein
MTLGPVVNALRNVSLGSAPAPETGLQTCATTTVSRIDVTADLAFIEGGTPTLSTISMSEAVDPSNATDMGETIESATDAFSVTSSHYRTSPPAAPRPMTTMHAAEPSRKSALPLRAPSLQQTASAFWSLSSYLRSFAPFTTPFSLVMSQKPGPARTPTAESETATVTPALGLDLGTASVALPAAARSTDEIIDPAAELVRSVPMNIVIAGNKAQAVIEERAREREAIEYLERSCSRERARNAAKTGAPVAETSDNERGRGRRRARREDSSRERDDVDTPSSESGNEEQRGRRRARGGESRDRSWSAARGRTSRTRGTAVRA